MSTEYPLSVQIAEVEREIKMRTGTYEARLRIGQMMRQDVIHRLGIMREVLKSLQSLRDAELAEKELPARLTSTPGAR
jgi:hypothetical protein